MSDPGAQSTAKPHRLFFALWPDDAVREQIVHTTRKVAGRGGRREPAENLHITLVFLGAVTGEQLPCIERAAAAVTGEPCTLTLDRYGHWSRPKILWLGPAATPPSLASLVTALHSALLPCGFTPDLRAWQPHVTLARKVAHAPRHDRQPDIQWPAQDFCLVESVTAPSGARYRVRRRWPLRATGAVS